MIKSEEQLLFPTLRHCGDGNDFKIIGKFENRSCMTGTSETHKTLVEMQPPPPHLHLLSITQFFLDHLQNAHQQKTHTFQERTYNLGIAVWGSYFIFGVFYDFAWKMPVAVHAGSEIEEACEGLWTVVDVFPHGGLLKVKGEKDGVREWWRLTDDAGTEQSGKKESFMSQTETLNALRCKLWEKRDEIRVVNPKRLPGSHWETRLPHGSFGDLKFRIKFYLVTL